jgi:hypothetical protein
MMCFKVLDIRFLEDVLMLSNSSTNISCSLISLLVILYTFSSSNNSATLSAVPHSL